MRNRTAIPEYASSLISMLDDATHEEYLTESDLILLKDVLSDLKETIQDVEFALFIAPYDEKFIQANKKIHEI